MTRKSINFSTFLYCHIPENKEEKVLMPYPKIGMNLSNMGWEKILKHVWNDIV